MHYKADGSEINIGDYVRVERDVAGQVVCDFDKWECLKGYEHWLTKEKLVGGGNLLSGIMVETKQLGMLHFPTDDEGILQVT